MKHILNTIFILFIFLHTTLWSQNSFIAKVDSTTMVIGDQQNLILTYTTSLNGLSPNFHIENLDTCTFFEPISQTQWIKTQTNTATIIEKKIRFSIYDEGLFKIPSVYAFNGTDSLATFEIPIEIKGVEPDSTGLLPIKGIIKEKNNWSDYIWLYSILGFILLTYALYRYIKYKNDRKAEEIIIPVEIKKSPHQIALEKLGSLKESRLWEKGEVKEYHSQLTYIIREYLENRYQIPALESTSLEIQREIKKYIPDHDILKSVDDVLNIADWVKFAKGIPEQNANALALERAIELVLFTKEDVIPSQNN